jgi:cystine transport system substrate-binding protein
MRGFSMTLTLGVALLCTGCYGPQSHNGNADRIRIATDAQFPPFHFLDNSEHATGHDVELARALLDRAGFNHTTTVVRPYSALLAGLENGTHDLVAATTGITPERQEKFLFSAPYFTTCQVVILRRQRNAPTSIAALGGMRIAAAGSGTSARARDQMGHIRPVAVASFADGLAKVQSGEIDGYVVDEFEAVPAVRANPGKLYVLPEPAALEHYGFAMPLNRPDLQKRLNLALAELALDGTVVALRERFEVRRDDTWPLRFGP